MGLGENTAFIFMSSWWICSERLRNGRDKRKTFVSADEYGQRNYSVAAGTEKTFNQSEEWSFFVLFFFLLLTLERDFEEQR